MRLILIFFIIVNVNLTGQDLHLNCKKQMDPLNELEQEVNKFIYNEVNEFIDSVNTKYYKIKKYFVFVIKISKQDEVCINYSIGFIFNESDFGLIKPEYIALDSNNLIVVSFYSEIQNKSFPGYNLVKVDPDKKETIRKKLLQEGYITGVFYGLELKRCGNKIEKIFYENADMIPVERSIFEALPIDGKIEIELIRKGY